ncbi:MAG: 1,4-dihydroxy-2-naphthoate polyprenyltransferase [Planctomycetes bacterium]|nr:1,4-dihydroxy-2-naphthoate polyprenyltransferase [Planctomycetota bacterium]
MNKTNLKIWTGALRPKTLPAAAAPVLIGGAMAFADGPAQPMVLVITFIAAMLIQIGTNLANDYYDHFKGADTEQRIGPVRATGAGLVKPSQMKAAFVIAFALAAVAGLYLVYKGGVPILVIGVASIICGVLYTAGPFALGYTGLADVFVLVFFGPVAVGGTYYLQTGTINSVVIIAGLAPGLLSTAILTVNNFRDIATDKQAGKKTLAVRFGFRFAIFEYIFCVVLGCSVPLVFCMLSGNRWSCLSLIAILFAFKNIKTIRTRPDGETCNKLLADTGKLLLVYIALFSVGQVL